MFAIYANDELEENSSRELDCYRIDNPLSTMLFSCGVEQHNEYARNKIDRIRQVTGCKAQDRNFEISF